MYTAFCAVLWILLKILVKSNGQVEFGCSVAFYPLTACSELGDRSAFVQFEYCNERETRVQRAWFGIRPIGVNMKTNASQLLPDTWKEVVIPRSKRRSGRLTVFYRRDNQENFDAIQMTVPACSNVN